MLWLLGVPLAPVLGVLTGLLTFIPNVGAVIALVLSMLMAMSQGMATVAWVVALYAVLQLLESNVITPLIQQHQTPVPPPLLLMSQLLMGVMSGFLGVMVATPLLAAALIFIREVYIKDYLEQSEESVRLSPRSASAFANR
ncbi:MAG: AI-2E family transporter, partial [Planctomycetales bacterium]|nr:AI-2E family transporter [Planctomycetales bacterium]